MYEKEKIINMLSNNFGLDFLILLVIILITLDKST